VDLNNIQRIAIPNDEGFDFIPAEHILYCQADGNYTHLFLVEGDQKKVISRPLKELEEKLESFSFVRIHHSFVVNLLHVERYIRGDGGAVVMSNGEQLPVSRSKKRDFLDRVR
jgi:two-component system LytT family response regulator